MRVSHESLSIKRGNLSVKESIKGLTFSHFLKIIHLKYSFSDITGNRPYYQANILVNDDAAATAVPYDLFPDLVIVGQRFDVQFRVDGVVEDAGWDAHFYEGRGRVAVGAKL